MTDAPENPNVQCVAYESPWPGTAKKCPRCHSMRVGDVKLPLSMKASYARTITVCASCGCAWEPLDETLIWDASDPVCSFKDPCDNCAFRPGSPEQQDKAKWREMISNLREEGCQFFCHKGVPLDPRGEHGWDYPQKTVVVEVEGVPPIETTVHDRDKMRLCRGYLNALGGWWAKERGV